MLRIILTLATLAVAGTASAATTFQITGSSWDYAELWAHYPDPQPYPIYRKADREAAPMDGYFTLLNYDPWELAGRHVSVCDGCSDSYSLKIWSHEVDFNIPYLNNLMTVLGGDYSTPYISISFDYEGMFEYIFLSAGGVWGSNSSVPEYHNKIQRDNSDWRVRWFGSLGTVRQLAPGETPAAPPIQPVPLPATGLLLIGGLAGVGFLRWRKLA